MKYTSYKGIKERITDYITRINDLKYRGYEKDINYLKNLCRNFQRTVGDEAEKVIVDHLDEFAIYLKQQEFYAVMKQDKFYKCIMNIKKRIRRQDFDKKDYDLSILDNLLNDYVIFKWKYYNSKFVDAEMIINIQRFDNRLKNIVMIIANNMNIQTIKR